MKYAIKVESGEIIKEVPIVGRWYVMFETVTNFHNNEVRERDGTIAKYIGNGFWVDEEDEDVETMVSEDLPSYLVLQY